MTEETYTLQPFDILSSGLYFIKALSMDQGELSVNYLITDLTSCFNASVAEIESATFDLICFFAVNQVIEIKDNSQVLMDYIYGGISTDMDQLVFSLHPYWCKYSSELKDLISCYYKGDPKVNVMKEWLQFNSIYREEYQEQFPSNLH